MATKDDRPGLLSKVAMFVRNPTRDWSELDQPAEGDAGGYDKQALKAMIERKRQNDFVRRREFDQLRKLRNRDPGALASMARPSFFQTSLSTDLDGRAHTLKKIDEIEAQMSRQWWKAKSQDSQAQAGDASTRPGVQSGPVPAEEDSQPYSANPDHSAFASTQPMDRLTSTRGDAEDFAPTMMAGDPLSVPGSEIGPDDRRSESSIGYSSSGLYSFDADEMATDPELEEAAIRFANGDDAGAEAGLLAALRGSVVVPLAAQSWVVALLDLYRATGNGHSFYKACSEFSLYLDGAKPEWVALGAMEPEPAEASTRAAKLFAGATWESPGVLTSRDVQVMRTALSTQPEPWTLGWSQLQEIAPDAMHLLDVFFGNLCQEAISLRFDGAESLARALRAATPSGDRKVERSWWTTRLNALRAMGMQDDFELAALDYCITFEAAPPEWAAVPCRIALSGLEPGATPAHDAGTSTAQMGIEQGESEVSLVLRGEILGDATLALAGLDADFVRGNLLAIDCGKLIRVDFAAAGSILNWVAERESGGKQVQFQNVHRLVATFFYVIGINEHARVIPRAI